jgi:glycogen operon protein
MNEGIFAPMGVHLALGGATIAIPAPNAEAVEFCLFEGDRETRYRLPHRVGDVFRGHVSGLAAGARYGLRVHGSRALRFNSRKLLLDPWAREIDRPFVTHPALFDEDPADSAPFMPKAVLTARLPSASRPPPRAGGAVLYELHVRGFSIANPAIPEEIRGTFAALGHPVSVSYLRGLGVTHVEIMPAAAWADERHLGPLGLTNYWGYNTVGWLAPDPRLAPGGMAEVRAAVTALAEAGIGTILDVVLNHSGEGDAYGPTLSLRGLHDARWYRARDGIYTNETGCGNSLALDRPFPLHLAMDAMRHWVDQAGLAGLRLDLATTLGRRAAGFDPDAPLLQAMRQDPLLSQCWIIAEPWDVGPGGYQLGAFPPGWGEWNDRFRDDVRQFWRGDAGSLNAMVTRLAGSRDVFGARSTADSINFVTAHDGFTLADLVSHGHKHNEANGEDNCDGTDRNLSWNLGVEGPCDALHDRRIADARALLATLLAARGTPMLSMGDEAGRSQRGNNNAWCQDNALSWFDWTNPDTELTAFTARLIAARHAHPALHGVAPLVGLADASGEMDVCWLRLDAIPMVDADWNSHDARGIAMLLHASGDRVLVAIHGDDREARLRLPPPRTGHAWHLLADSADPARSGIGGEEMRLAPRSVLWFAEMAATRRAGGAADAALLGELAHVAGIDPAWHDIDGRRHEVPAETLRALLAALDLPANSAAQARESLARRRALPPSTASEQLRCYAPPEGRRYAIMAQTFSLRRSTDQGIGDYAALAELGAQASGASLIGLSPPHALMPVERERASPYQPSDRRFLEPVLLDLAPLASMGDSVSAALEVAEPAFAALRGSSVIDYTAVWGAKRPVLEAAFRVMPRGALDAFRHAGGKALEDFAGFAALSERFGPRDMWPGGFRHPGDFGIAAFRAEGAEAIGFHIFLQWLCDRQLAAASAVGPGLYRDLAVGAASDGAEVWSQPGAFLRDFSIGAPPDPFAVSGQIWGVPVPNPHRAAAEGHATFAALVAANMRHARALRLDHAMGLERLFVIPDGARACEGCYLRYDAAGMLEALARESSAARCSVIGEALGTVPHGFQERLAAAGVLAYRVLWFERDAAGFRDPMHWPAFAACCVSTHDLPPLAGWWEGGDIAEAEALGLLAPAAAALARQHRAADRAAIAAASGVAADCTFGPAVAGAVYRHVSQAPCATLLVAAEDLLGETIGVNLPGTDKERPNWRMRYPVTVDALFSDPYAVEILGSIDRHRSVL